MNSVKPLHFLALLNAAILLSCTAKAELIEVKDLSILASVSGMQDCPCSLPNAGATCTYTPPNTATICEMESSGACEAPGTPHNSVKERKKDDKCGTTPLPRACTLADAPYCADVYVSFCETVTVSVGHINNPPAWIGWILGVPPTQVGFFCAARRPSQTTQMGTRKVATGSSCE